MKKAFLVLFGVVSVSFMAQAQSVEFTVPVQADNSPIIVTGAAPAETQVVYNQPVTYNAAVQYTQPIQYNASVQYNAPAQYYAPVNYYSPSYTTIVQNPPADASAVACDAEPAVCDQTACADQSSSSVQVIYFGQSQAQQQGYSFNAPR